LIYEILRSFVKKKKKNTKKRKEKEEDLKSMVGMVTRFNNWDIKGVQMGIHISFE